MTSKKRKFIIPVVTIVLLLVSVTAVLADELTGFEPTTTEGVVPYLGDPPFEGVCQAGSISTFDLFGEQGKFNNPTQDTITKTFTIDGIDVTITTEPDVNNTFKFTITGGSTTRVYEKSGNNPTPLIYDYDPAVSYDTGLHNGIAGDGGYADVSHISFCITTIVPLTAEKTAAGTFEQDITWEIDKSVSPASHTGNAGETAGTSTWTVVATKTIGDPYNYEVAGSITVFNANSFAVAFSIADTLDDGTNAAVTCPVTGDNTGTVLAASGGVDGSVTCTYLADGATAEAVKNTAVVTSLSDGVEGATAEKTFVYVGSLNGDESVTVDDDRDTEGQFPTDISVSTTFDYDETFECSTDRADYNASGVDQDTYPNIATLDGPNTDLADDASVVVTCEASFVDIYKTTNDAPADPSQDIQFTLFSGVDALETVSTEGVGSDLEFQTALVPGDGYTICEFPVPAGYTFEVSENGSVVLTYAGPPGEENPTGDIQCFDFTAPDPDTQVVLTFNIENSFPGGAPRTPGYWKNWNTCSDGNQESTAFKLNGGLDPSDPDSAGVFLLDDLLPQTLGDSLAIDTCEDGVLILDARDLTEVDKKGNPVNRSNDAAYTLARALLAARLNQDAGACTAAGYDFLGVYGFDVTFEQLLTVADDVLSAVEFDGSGSFLSPQDLKGQNNPLVPLAEEALYLYEIIDDYNNGLICTGEPSH